MGNFSNRKKKLRVNIAIVSGKSHPYHNNIFKFSKENFTIRSIKSLLLVWESSQIEKKCSDEEIFLHQEWEKKKKNQVSAVADLYKNCLIWNMLSKWSPETFTHYIYYADLYFPTNMPNCYFNLLQMPVLGNMLELLLYKTCTTYVLKI